MNGTFVPFIMGGTWGVSSRCGVPSALAVIPGSGPRMTGSDDVRTTDVRTMAVRA
jgi:hypothetical protein